MRLKTLLLGLALAMPVFTAASRELRVTDDQLYCLALNDYYEARGEPLAGRVAVAYVVMNRVQSPLYPKTICEVVFQHNGRACAFSWVCERYDIKEVASWERSKQFAKRFMQEYSRTHDPTKGAVHYHEASILPYWALGYTFHIAIGEHLFYPKQTAKRN